MVTTSQHLATPLPVGAAVLPGTLRARPQAARARGDRFNPTQAAGTTGPLCADVAGRHRAAHRLFVPPSALIETEYAYSGVSPEHANNPPILPRDKACLSPEERT